MALTWHCNFVFNRLLSLTRCRLIPSDSSNELSPEPEYAGDPTPVYDIPKGQYSAEMVLQMLLDPDETRICSERPTNIHTAVLL